MLTPAKTGVGAVTRRLVLLALWLAAPVALAQVDATQWRMGTVDLTRGWLEHDGDNPAWAQPNFDDSGWQKVDLDDLGAATLGTRWYRLHVQLAPNHPHLHILIAGGEGTYEMYVNGQLVEGTQIRSLFGVKRPTERVYAVRDEDTALTIALRTLAPATYTSWYLPLFLTAATGTPKAIEHEQQAMESQRLYAALPSIAINMALMLAGIAAFALYRSQRKHAEYLWLGLYLFLLGLSNLLLNCSSSGVLSLAWNNLLADPLIYVFTIMQIQFTFSFAGQRLTRVWRVYQGALLATILVTVLVNAGEISGGHYLLVEAAAILPAALLMPALLFVWYRRGNREAGWLILPSLLPAATAAITDVGSASIYTGWGKADFLTYPIHVGPVPLQMEDLGDFLFLVAIGVVMFFRFTKVSREQARVQAELHAAREIQRRLVPERLPEIEGYEVEAAYFPAEEVGGDFYQVLESKGNAKLVVVGDVSGKGLKAAMTGTLAMGALRALATEGLGPGALLMRLNRQLLETSDEGFVTCICARVGPKGDVTLANAGHLPPYRNGEELLLEPDLPLGIAPEEKYAEHTFQLEPGDQMTLLSDGVVEARDARGALFGFDRTREISAQSAAAIAEAALKHGQADDITVVTLMRTKGGESVLVEAMHAAATVRG
ncbi:MAG: PP2C family protein-serine/threonine phosphatase [Acidobacteriaceae bacterium]